MSNITRRIDPVAQTAQFKADLDKMAEGQTKNPLKSRLHPKNFGKADYKANRWSAELSEKQALEDALDPTFWVDQAGQIMRCPHKGLLDIIELRKPDAALYAELVILGTGAGYVKVKVLKSAQDDQIDIPAESPLTTKWSVGTKTYEVIRQADKVTLSAGFQTKAAAAAWIADHLSKMAA